MDLPFYVQQINDLESSFEALSDDELDQLIQDAIKESGAESIRDMGKVMGILKPKVQGRADMGALSSKIKQLLQP